MQEILPSIISLTDVQASGSISKSRSQQSTIPLAIDWVCRGEAGRGEAGRGEAGRGEAGRGEAGRGKIGVKARRGAVGREGGVGGKREGEGTCSLSESSGYRRRKTGWRSR